MSNRQYYSVRTGKNQKPIEIDLDILRRGLYTIYLKFTNEGYFQEAFGYWCVDLEDVAGSIGSDIELYFLRKLRKQNLWPIFDKYSEYTEDDTFDVIELLFDLVSKPIEGDYHSYNNCGWHYYKFDKKAGQDEFRIAINDYLRDYYSGYEISKKGEILSFGEYGVHHLLEASIPVYEPDHVDKRIEAAVLKYRRHRSSNQDRKDSVRDLADILEFLRPKLKDVLMTKDESDLFNIANNFAIRHHNDKQKNDYDPVWLSWIFYIYLATIHLSIRLISRTNK